MDKIVYSIAGLPIKHCLTATPYYVSTLDTCFDQCPNDYSRQAATFTCTSCATAEFANSANSWTCQACPTACTICSSSVSCLLCSTTTTALCVSETVILISSPSTATPISPSGYTTVEETSVYSQIPVDLGAGAKWIFLNGSHSWPNGFTATFLSLFTPTCTSPAAILRVAVDDSLVVYLNGLQIGSGVGLLSYSVSLACGSQNNLTTVVINGVGGQAVIFTITQCKSSEFINSLKNCQACPSACATCSSSTTCLTCLSGFYLSPNSYCSPSTYLMLSSPASATVLSPAGSFPILQTTLEASLPNRLDNGAQWIFINGSLSWPASYTATLQSLSTLTDCTHFHGILQLVVDDYFEVYFNGQLVDSQTTQTTSILSYKIQLACGTNNLTVKVTKNQSAGAEGVVYSITQCAIDTFVNALNECQACPLLCATCTSLTICQSCQMGNYLNSSSLCSSTCPSRYYPNTLTNICSVCPTGCLTCSSALVCSTCSPNYNLNVANMCVA